MSVFTIQDDEYSVEEISYEDMMSLLENQRQNDSELTRVTQMPEQDKLAKRITDNANLQLPSWLLNH